MRFAHGSLLIVLVIFLFALAPGCSQKGEKSAPDTSLTSEGMEELVHPISLQEALGRAGDVFGPAEFGEAATLPVYVIQAKRVDPEGRAETWILGMKNEGENIFVVVQSNRIVLAPASFDLPDEEIRSSEIVDPATLIMKSRKLFTDAGGREPLILSELELSGGIYTVTFSTPSGTKVLSFNASTGNPIR